MAADETVLHCGWRWWWWWCCCYSCFRSRSYSTTISYTRFSCGECKSLTSPVDALENVVGKVANGSVWNEEWYIVAALQEKASHTFHAKKTILSWHCMEHHACAPWRIPPMAQRTGGVRCACLCVLVQLCSACMNWSVLWYIFHVDIATHKLHIIHRVSVWLHKCYEIYLPKCDTLTCTQWYAWFLSLSLLWPNFDSMYLVFFCYSHLRLSLSNSASALYLYHCCKSYNVRIVKYLRMM